MKRSLEGLFYLSHPKFRIERRSILTGSVHLVDIFYRKLKKCLARSCESPSGLSHLGDGSTKRFLGMVWTNFVFTV